MKTIHVRITPWKVVAYSSALLFGGAFFGSLLAGEFLASVFLILFFIPSVILVLAYGPISFGEAGIEMHAPTGVYSIQWNEIQSVRFGQSHLVFEGGTKRLTIPQSAYWKASDRTAAVEIITLFMEKASLTPKYSYSSDFLISKNTRIRNEA